MIRPSSPTWRRQRPTWRRRRRRTCRPAQRRRHEAGQPQPHGRRHHVPRQWLEHVLHGGVYLRDEQVAQGEREEEHGGCHHEANGSLATGSSSKSSINFSNCFLLLKASVVAPPLVIHHPRTKAAATSAAQTTPVARATPSPLVRVSLSTARTAGFR